MIRVKIFKDYKQQVETQLNEWMLSKYDIVNHMSNIGIHQINQSVDDNGSIVISVFYYENQEEI